MKQQWIVTIRLHQKKQKWKHLGDKMYFFFIIIWGCLHWKVKTTKTKYCDFISYHYLFSFNLWKYQKFLRIFSLTFEMLIGLDWTKYKKNTNFPETISVRDHSAITPKFLEIGDSYHSLMYQLV